MKVLAFRRAEERDLSFILDSWSQSFCDSHAAGPIPMPLYTGIMRDQILPWMLARPGVDVLVAYNPGETDPKSDLHGWIATERGMSLPVRVRERVGNEVRMVTRMKPTTMPLLHFVFVKQTRRRFGIARALFAAARIELDEPFLFAFKGASWSRLRHLVPRATWNPLIARFSKGAEENL